MLIHQLCDARSLNSQHSDLKWPEYLELFIACLMIDFFPKYGPIF